MMCVCVCVCVFLKNFNMYTIIIIVLCNKYINFYIKYGGKKKLNYKSWYLAMTWEINKINKLLSIANWNFEKSVM